MTIGHVRQQAVREVGEPFPPSEPEYWKWLERYVAMTIDAGRFMRFCPVLPRNVAAVVWGLTLNDPFRLFDWQRANLRKIRLHIGRAARSRGYRFSKYNVLSPVKQRRQTQQQQTQQTKGN